MSLKSELKITDGRMAKYSPLDQLSDKYRKQVVERSKVMAFEAGEALFPREETEQFTFYLLAGALKIKKGLFSSDTLPSDSPDAFFPLNARIGTGVSAKAVEAGSLLLIDTQFLDRCLAWTEAEAEHRENSKVKAQEPAPGEVPSQPQVKVSRPAPPDSEEFDEAYFDWMSSLMEFPMFFNLPPSNIEKIFNRFERVEVARDQSIIREGDPGDYFYLLIEGSARVIVGGDESRPIRISKGSYFGEEALVSKSVRTATVTMTQDGVLARLDTAAFESLLHDPLVNYVSVKDYKDHHAREPGEAKLLDIRSPAEFERKPVRSCQHIPLADLRAKTDRLNSSYCYYLTPQGGLRNEVAAHILCQHNLRVFVIGESRKE